jgi:hypothetical protein
MVFEHIPLVTKLMNSDTLPCGALFKPSRDFFKAKDFEQLWKLYDQFNYCVFTQEWPKDVQYPTELTEDDYKWKYFVFESTNDLGDRMVATTSAVFYAMLTGRAFVLEWRVGKNHPSNFEDLFDASKVSFLVNNNSFKRRTILHKYFGSIYWKSVNHKERLIWEKEDPPKLKGFTDDYTFHFSQDYICSSFFSKSLASSTNNANWYSIVSARIQYMVSNQYFATILKRNEDVKRWLNEKMPDGQLFVRLGRKIYTPREEVMNIVRDFVKRNPKYYETFNLAFGDVHLSRRNEKDITVGVHIRTFSGPNDENRVFQCLEHSLYNAALFVKKDYNFISKKISIMLLGYPERRLKRLRTMVEGLSSDISRSKVLNVKNVPKPAFDPVLNATDIHNFNLMIQEDGGLYKHCAVVIARQIEESKPPSSELSEHGVVCSRMTLAEIIAFSLNDISIHTAHSNYGAAAEIWRRIPDQIYERGGFSSSPVTNNLDFWGKDNMNKIWVRTVTYWPYDNTVNIQGSLQVISKHLGRSLGYKEWFSRDGFCATTGTTEPEYLFKFKIRDKECRKKAKLPGPGERLIV